VSSSDYEAPPTDISLAEGAVKAQVKAIYANKSFVVSTSGIDEGTSIGIILDRTCFYAEAGGQEYDTGNIVIDGVADFEVTSVQSFSGYVLHIGTIKYGALSVNDSIVATYDEVNTPAHLGNTAT
jgi:alanyl-tRNA synthetase